MKKIWTLTFVLFVAAAFLATPCLAKTTWNANSVWPPKNNHSVGLTEFAEKVKTATNGELELMVSSGGALGYKGPELLNKYVGETERQIRLIFQRAREKSEEGVPVIVFFDEMDSLFRTRGSGVSSDVENTIVNGRILMRNRVVRTLDEPAVLAAARKLAERVREAVRQ